jgi:hypothetical protein
LTKAERAPAFAMPNSEMPRNTPHEQAAVAYIGQPSWLLLTGGQVRPAQRRR